MESLICTFIHNYVNNTSNNLCVPRIIKTIHLSWNGLPLMEYFLVRRHDMWWLQIMVSNNSNFGHFTFLSDYLMRCLFTVLSFRFRLFIENVNVIKYLKHKADHFIRKNLWSVHTLSNIIRLNYQWQQMLIYWRPLVRTLLGNSLHKSVGVMNYSITPHGYKKYPLLEMWTTSGQCLFNFLLFLHFSAS